MVKKVNNNEEISFYKKLNHNEKLLIDDLRKYAKKALPFLVENDTKYYFGFKLSKVKDGEINYNYFWVTRDEKNKLLFKIKKKSTDKTPYQKIKLTKVNYNECVRLIHINFVNKNDATLKTLTSIRNKEDIDYQSDVERKVNLMVHQKYGALLARKYNKFAFFYDTGTGKTIMSLEIMSYIYNQFKTKFLVVAPKPLIRSAWIDDSLFFPKMKILPLSNNISKEDYMKIYDYWNEMDGLPKKYDNSTKISKEEFHALEEDLIKRAQHYIINIDRIRESNKGKELVNKLNVKGLIVDESSILRNYYSGNSQRIRVLSKEMDYVYLLSGTPAPNSIIEYFSQMVIVDHKTFNMSYKKFIDTYFKQPKKFKLVIKSKKMEQELITMIGNRSLIVKKDECIDLPPLIHKRIEIELKQETKHLYGTILSKLVEDIITSHGEVVKTKEFNNIAQLIKLREIASGIYYDDNQKLVVDNAKVEQILNLLEMIGYEDNGLHKKVIIWCNFKEEIKLIKEALESKKIKVATAYSETKNLDEMIEVFKNGDAEILIAHPKTLKYGVTLTKCHYAIFDSLSFSYEDFYQARSRIHRKNQQNNCIVYFMISKGTVDEYVYDCVIEKQDKTAILEKLIKSSSKFNIDKVKVKLALQNI